MKVLLTLLLAGTLAACGPQASESELTESTKLENEDLTDTLAGVDANGDDVRDDIETHLKKRLADKPDALYWALELAKSETATVLATTRQQAMESGQRRMSALDCMANATQANPLVWIAISQDITAFSFNTERRLRAYNLTWQLRNGGSFITGAIDCRVK